MNTTMKTILLIAISVVFWFVLVFFGVGAQSLSQIIEIPIILIFTLVVSFLMRDKKFIFLIVTVLIFVAILRVFMPLIPE